MAEQELPRPQTSFRDLDLSKGETYAMFLQKRLPEGMPLNAVKTVTDLYCGNGILTIGSIALFSKATINAVDYHRVLVPDAIAHPRVKFYQGWVSDVLATGKLAKTDVMIMSFASRHHGFTAENIHLLSDNLQGVLLTLGDNGGIEAEPWFRERFKVFSSDSMDDSAVWVVRE
jgi:hypothetical protein